MLRGKSSTYILRSKVFSVKVKETHMMTKGTVGKNYVFPYIEREKAESSFSNR